MTFDLFSGFHMQIQTWHPPLWLCTHAKYYVKSGLTNVLKNANKTKNRHLFRFGLPTISIYGPLCEISRRKKSEKLDPRMSKCDEHQTLAHLDVHVYPVFVCVEGGGGRVL